MKWRVRKPHAKDRRLNWWHNWFAWYPVRVPTRGRMSGMTMIWMQSVQRRGRAYGDALIGYWEWEYKTKEVK